MPEDKGCELLQPPRSSDKKRRKKNKRKKATVSSSPPENAEKLQAVSLPPETLPLSLLPPQRSGQPRGLLPKPRGTSRKDRQRLGGSGRRTIKHPKDSPALLMTTNKTSAGGVPAQGYVAELSSQAKESMRWEGELEDPQAEEKRLELYRANRRQRYVKHREDRLTETQNALRQIFPIERKKALSGCDQQETVSLLHVSTD